MDKAAEYYKQTRVRHGNTDYVADDPSKIAIEAATEYVGHRASVMWQTLDTLYYILQHDLNSPRQRPRDPFGLPDLTSIRRDVDKLTFAYAKKMDEKIFGYEKDGDTEYRVVDKRVQNFLSDVCDKDLLEIQNTKSLYGCA